MQKYHNGRLTSKSEDKGATFRHEGMYSSLLEQIETLAVGLLAKLLTMVSPIGHGAFPIAVNM